LKEEEEKGTVDMEVLAECLSECIYALNGKEKAWQVPFMGIEMLHLYMGEEFMKRLVRSSKIGIFFGFGPSMFWEDYYIPFSRYFEEMGLTKEMYLTESAHGLPLHYLCRESCQYSVGIEQLVTVPKDIIEEGMLLQDTDGNTMLHMTMPDDVVTASTEIFLISYRKALKYLSTFKDYEKGLLTVNKKGETPLHTIIANSNCVKTIEYLLETDAGKKAATIKDNDGNTPYMLMKKYEEYFGVYGKEDKETVTNRLFELGTQCNE
jgi:hypothetical protein